MKSELVQIGQTPQMDLCSICPSPGICCSNFKLYYNNSGENLSFDHEDYESVNKILKEYSLPFFVLNFIKIDDEYVPRFGCFKLKGGRCSDYENRPSLCKDFEPNRGDLCVFNDYRINYGRRC